jgi:hypothetical protein
MEERRLPLSSLLSQLLVAFTIEFDNEFDIKQRELLFSGLVPYPDGWCATRPTPEVLPHYTMVLHHGGYPDGS